MRNGGELSDLEYLAMKTEYTKYLQIANMRTSCPFGPIKWYNSRCKQAQDHKKQWRIDLPRLPAHQAENAKYLQNTDIWASCLLGPIKWHWNTF